MELFQNYKIALVEDEDILRKELAFQLRYLGFATEEFSSAAQFYRRLCVQSFIAVILDIGLVGEEGFESGADYYFVKPIDIMELSLAIRRIVERMNGELPQVLQHAVPTAEVLVCGAWLLDESSGQLVFLPQENSITLSLAESHLIKILFLAQGKVVEHKTFLVEMGLEEGEVGKHRLEVMVSRLRHKVRRQLNVDIPIQVRRGVGYYMTAE